MGEYPKCPKCGGFLIPKKYTDFDVENDEFIAVIIYGECDNCHTPFTWGEEYRFDMAYDIEEWEAD